MSRTRRKDPIDVNPPFKPFVLMGETLKEDRSPAALRRAHMDRKKRHKPGRKAKIFLHKGQKAKPKQALRAARDYDNLPHPKQPRTDVWLYA